MLFSRATAPQPSFNHPPVLLAMRGYRAVDADGDGLPEVVTVPLDIATGLDSGQDWVWREDRIEALLFAAATGVFFLAGCAPNQGNLYPRFDHIVLLTAPAAVIVERLATRTNNPYGKRPEEITRTLAMRRTIEPLLRRDATAEIDSSVPLDAVVTRILRIVGEAA
ncbi:MAG: hypothetical protein U0031_00505 [Thermomicrobiales bacterium]